ncbi:hypothetical protein J3B02_003498 [Coemansia erecta]|nr:hypothetical protein J3B02_003498 [Coemansia erecta]
MAVAGGLWRSINSLAAFVAGNAKSLKTSGSAIPSVWMDIEQETLAVCTTYRFGLALLALRHLRICTLGVMADSELSWQVTRAKTELTRMARAELRRICDAANNALEHNLSSGSKSRRSKLAAHFSSLFASAFSTSTRQQPDSPLGLLVLDNVVLPLAVAGASPELFLEIARLVGETLRCAKVAMAIVDLVVPRFDAIWDHHTECRSWQMDWNRLQTAWGAKAKAKAKSKAKANANISAVQQANGSEETMTAWVAKTCSEQDSAQNNNPVQRALANGNNCCGSYLPSNQGRQDEKSRPQVLQQLVDLADEFERRRLERASLLPAQSSRRAAKTGDGAWASSGSACLSEKAGVSKVKEDELGLVFLGNRRRSRTKQ